jgi:hypothetical protein
MLALGADLCDQAHAHGRAQAARMCGYVGDAGYSAQHDPVASVTYIAARAANHRSRSEHADPYAAERAWQAEWLVRQLALV